MTSNEPDQGANGVARFSLSNLDAVEFLRQLPSSSIDLLITDPPYESLEKHRKVGTTTRLTRSKASSNRWFGIFPNSRFPEFFSEVYRALKKNTHFYLFCDSETMFTAKPIGELSGFRFWKPIIWDKVAMGMGYHYRARCERILFFEKGKRRLNDLGVPDILRFPRIRNGYPTEKPAELMATLISQSSNHGDLVADPFMGAGSVGVAALRLGRRFVGSDIAGDAIALTHERLVNEPISPQDNLDTRVFFGK